MSDLATELKKVAFQRIHSDYSTELATPLEAFRVGRVLYARELLKQNFHWTDEEIQARIEK